ALTTGPSAGEALVGRPAEQVRIRVQDLVELELVAVLAAIEVERPTLVLELLTSRGLHYPVYGHEFGDNEPSHPSSSLSRRRVRRLCLYERPPRNRQRFDEFAGAPRLSRNGPPTSWFGSRRVLGRREPTPIEGRDPTYRRSRNRGTHAVLT